MVLSVVIVAYNSLGELQANFPGIRSRVEAEEPQCEFIIVDNASGDGSAVFVRGQLPGVTLQEEPANVFFGQAANRGVELARGELVLLLNPDVAVDRLGWSEVLERFRNEPRLFAVQPQVQDPRDGSRERLFSLAMRRGIVDLHPAPAAADEAGREIPFATGGVAFFRRSLFLELGGFDPLFSPFYWEDVDLGVRAARKGLKSVFLPHSRFLHWHSTIIGRHHGRREIQAVFERNRLLFLYKHVSVLSLAFLAHAFWLVPRLIRSLAGDRSFLKGFLALPGKMGQLRLSRRSLRRSRPAVSLGGLLARFKGFRHG